MGKQDQEILNSRIEEAQQMESAKKKKEKKKELKKKNKFFWGDFKKFITKGNILDLAVAVVIGNAFNKIVSSMVKDILTPFVSFFLGNTNMSEWKYVMKPEILDEAGEVVKAEIAITYGVLLQNILDFLVIAFFIFLILRVVAQAKTVLFEKEIEEKKAADAKKKAEEDAKKKVEAEKAEALAVREAEFYANVKKQTELLEKIAASVNKPE
jgi:large conductance mechanosensitive channel